MLGSLFHKAQLTLDFALSQVLQKAAVGVLFLVAAIYAVVSLSYYLDRQLGPELGNLAMAGLFAALGLIGVAVATRPSASDEAAEQIKAEQALEDKSGTSWLRPEDRDFVVAALQSMAPIVGPRVAKSVLRNVPLLIVAAIIAFVLSRRTANEPAESEAQTTSVAAS